MAQTQRRMIYTKIWTSEQFSRLSDKAKLLYVGMITLADDDGRLIANPSYLRGQIFTYDDIPIDEVLKLRKIIEEEGLIIVYSILGNDYIEHPKWLEYQRIRGDLYRKSSLPTRNGSVTVPLLKSSLSKDKISKDKRERGTTPTPSEINKDFFEKKGEYNTLLDIYSKGKDLEFVNREFKKFIFYWTEPTKDGKRQRWELERTFDVKRRLITWFSKDFNKK